MAWRRALAAVLLLAATACTPSTRTAPAPSPTPAGGTVVLKVRDRPFTLHIPKSYNPAKPAPLLVLLHGYTASGAMQESYLKFTPESDRLGLLYAYPDGLTDAQNNRYWNATDACCDLYRTGTDDSGYLSDVIKKIEATYPVDTRRVYLAGHSNGAFMAYRMACDHADQITAIAALNGAMWSDASRCKPSGPVSVLDIRGTADQTITYTGGAIVNHPYPSAAQTEADWVKLDHCSGTAQKAPPLDLVADLPGAETSVLRYTAGCAQGSTVEVWTMAGGQHVPSFGSGFAPAVAQFLLSQAKP